jgi:hypothetical protein
MDSLRCSVSIFHMVFLFVRTFNDWVLTGLSYGAFCYWHSHVYMDIIFLQTLQPSNIYLTVLTSSVLIMTGPATTINWYPLILV